MLSRELYKLLLDHKSYLMRLHEPIITILLQAVDEDVGAYASLIAEYFLEEPNVLITEDSLAGIVEKKELVVVGN